MEKLIKFISSCYDINEKEVAVYDIVDKLSTCKTVKYGIVDTHRHFTVSYDVVECIHGEEKFYIEYPVYSGTGDYWQESVPAYSFVDFKEVFPYEKTIIDYK